MLYIKLNLRTYTDLQLQILGFSGTKTICRHFPWPQKITNKNSPDFPEGTEVQISVQVRINGAELVDFKSSISVLKTTNYTGKQTFWGEELSVTEGGETYFAVLYDDINRRWSSVDDITHCCVGWTIRWTWHLTIVMYTISIIITKTATIIHNNYHICRGHIQSNKWCSSMMATTMMTTNHDGHKLWPRRPQTMTTKDITWWNFVFWRRHDRELAITACARITQCRCSDSTLPEHLQWLECYREFRCFKTVFRWVFFGGHYCHSMIRRTFWPFKLNWCTRYHTEWILNVVKRRNTSVKVIISIDLYKYF